MTSLNSSASSQVTSILFKSRKASIETSAVRLFPLWKGWSCMIECRSPAPAISSDGYFLVSPIDVNGRDTAEPNKFSSLTPEGAIGSVPPENSATSSPWMTRTSSSDRYLISRSWPTNFQTKGWRTTPATVLSGLPLESSRSFTPTKSALDNPLLPASARSLVIAFVGSLRTSETGISKVSSSCLNSSSSDPNSCFQ